MVALSKKIELYYIKTYSFTVESCEKVRRRECSMSILNSNSLRPKLNCTKKYKYSKNTKLVQYEFSQPSKHWLFNRVTNQTRESYAISQSDVSISCSAFAGRLNFLRGIYFFISNFQNFSTMKKRTCRHYCPTCFLSFEDRRRYDVHIASKSHQDCVALRNDEKLEREEIWRCDDDNNIMLCPDECDLFDKLCDSNGSPNATTNTQRHMKMNDFMTNNDTNIQTTQDNYNKYYLNSYK